MTLPPPEEPTELTGKQGHTQPSSEKQVKWDPLVAGNLRQSHFTAEQNKLMHETTGQL